MSAPAHMRPGDRHPQPSRFACHARLLAACGYALALLAIACTAGPASAQAAPATHSVPAVDTVVVVLSPFLTWDDFKSPDAIDLRILAGAGAIGDMNCVTADPGWPTAAGGALTLGAGKWTAGSTTGAATPASLPAIQAANSASLNPPDIGALGAVLHAAGLKTAALGNGDEDTSTARGVRAPAALVAMDRTGHVDDLLADSSLLASDSAAPYGVRFDAARFADAVHAALAERPALLVIDPGDLERAHDAPNQTAAQMARNHANAVGRLSRLLASASTALVGRRSLLMLVTPATDKPYYEPPYLGPTVVVGDGFHGDLLSASTHRRGLVTNLDVAPTVLSALWLETTSTMIGQPMTSTNPTTLSALESATSPDLDARIAAFSTLGRSVGAVDYTRDLLFLKPFCDAAIVLIVLASAAALLGAARLVRPLARWALLLALAVPSGAWLLFAVDRYPLSPGRVLLAFGVATLGIFALVVALAVALKSRPEVPLLALSTLTSLLICLDQWTGHPFESGLFSYSIRAGWRYYGMGNEGAALLVGASIAAVALACDLAENTRVARPLRLWLLPAVAAVAIVTTAAPFAGANAGVVVWGAVAYGAAWARLNGIRFSWRVVGSIALGIVVLVAAVAGLSMLGGSGAQTHIGRFFGELGGGDFSSVQALVVRKAINNYDYLPQTPYTPLAAWLVLALAALYWGGDRPLSRALAAHPGMGAAVLGLLAGGVAATLSEDSGVVMPALMLFAGAPPAIYLALLENPAPESLDPDVT